MATAPAKPVAAPDPAPGTATVTSAPAFSGQANFLDTALVLSGMAMVGGVLIGLFFIHDVGQANLPIIAGLAGTLLGTVVGGYSAYRWGASDAMKKLTATTTSTPAP